MRNGNRLYLRYSLTGFFLLILQVLPAQIPLPRTLWSGPDTVTVAIAGDIMLHGKQIEKASRPEGAFDFSPFLENVEPLIAGADIAIGNLEFPLAGPPYLGYPCFSAPDEYACYLADKGFDIFLAANNQLAWPTNDGKSMRGFRAYFIINRTVITPSMAPRNSRARIVEHSDTATGVESVQPSAFGIQKVLRNGQLILLRGDKEYDAQGQRIK